MGEGTGGEAHELKQGAHDEEEELVYCSTHTHARACTGKHTQTDDRVMNVFEYVCVLVSGDGGRGMSVL